MQKGRTRVATSQPNILRRTIKAFNAMPRAEQAFTLMAGTAFVGAGVALGPMALRADDGAGEAPETRVIVESGMPQDADQAALVEGIAQVFRSCKAIIGERAGVGNASASITMWQADVEDIGSVNLTEILTVGHNTLLQTMTVFMAPDGPPDAPAPRWLIYSDDPSKSWRTTPGATASVIATGVQEMRVSRSSEPGGSATVRVGLTWAPGMSDATEETVLAITMPAFQGRSERAPH